uniref:Uncharacterized protein n=1 Tax=Vespula pensylvanica TaxID=30213 RepID=A0A834NYT4_VESPE|nr:hypothetical protein H0235_009424 [Vespula pensylvanica]
MYWLYGFTYCNTQIVKVGRAFRDELSPKGSYVIAESPLQYGTSKQSCNDSYAEIRTKERPLNDFCPEQTGNWLPADEAALL